MASTGHIRGPWQDTRIPMPGVHTHTGYTSTNSFIFTGQSNNITKV